MLGIPSDSDEYQALRDELRRLEDSGGISRGSRRRYGIAPEIPAEITGILKMQPTGNGIVQPDKSCNFRDTILIRARSLSNALHGDKVKVALYAAKEGERPQGEILTVLERASKVITGTIDRSHHQLYVKPDSGKMARDVIVTKKDLGGAKLGDKVKVELYDWEDERHDPEGRVLEVFGKQGSFQVEMQALAAEYGLSKEFPKEVMHQVASIPESIPAEEIAKRLDLRKKTIFTIDPEDAKDFDDAVSLEDNDDGTVTLGVHIADVSHYVTENSPLDMEALNRGTSVYLAGGVIPMLPEKLSNDICSLKPDVERLTYSAIMKVDEKTGYVLESSFAKSVIKSVMRFTYEEAELRTTSGKGKYAKLLKRMRALSVKMYELRRSEGSIDFETDEVRFRFDEKGNPTESYKKERLGSMRMIEDFMLAANKAVAEAIGKMGDASRTIKPFLYRIHADPDPDKLSELARLAKGLGYSLNPENVSPRSIQKFLESVKGKPEERMLNSMMLRAMAKAVYAEHNVGHFGLAFMHYTHFTSPIRRYPDLIVHRMLNEYFSHGGMVTKRERYYFNLLPEIADHTSATERSAVEAERESVSVAHVFMMRDMVGEEFEGTITGIQKYGCFVQLASGAEGLLHIRELPGYYIYDEDHMLLYPQRGASRGAKQRSFRIGEKVLVKLIRVDEMRRKLDFALAEYQ
jgi:ribonuclease R